MRLADERVAWKFFEKRSTSGSQIYIEFSDGKKPEMRKKGDLRLKKIQS